MNRTGRATWAIAVAVSALLVVASVDALRSSSAPPPESRATTEAEQLASGELVATPPERPAPVTEACVPVFTRLEADRVTGGGLAFTLVNMGPGDVPHFAAAPSHLAL